jgi:phage terminase Nu1 subunit (DNA packaging protein)
VEEESPEPNPFDDYRASRQAKRKRAMEQAREGMSAVAGERQAAESEAASKKLAAAQAEAAAMQKHAEKLAAVEQEALEQRKNSWSARLKNIVASTVSTATGVFFGSVGQRAGEAVTDAVFNDK